MSLKIPTELQIGVDLMNIRLSSGALTAHEYYVRMFNLIIQAQQLGYSVSHSRRDSFGDLCVIPINSIHIFIKHGYYTAVNTVILVW